jgi:hypothetical protein
MYDLTVDIDPTAWSLTKEGTVTLTPDRQLIDIFWARDNDTDILLNPIINDKDWQICCNIIEQQHGEEQEEWLYHQRDEDTCF